MILIKRISFLSILLFFLFLAIVQAAGANPVVITADEDWLPPGTLVSGSAQGDSPVLARASNGEMMIVYNQWVGDSPNQTNGYYSISNNNGQSWSTPAVISATAGVRQFVQVTYDRQNKAHAVWVQTPSSSSYRVMYANKPSGGGWTTPVVLSTITNLPVPIRQAKIIESQPNVIDIIWDEPVALDAPDTSLWHIRSTNGGTSWGSKTRVIASSVEPEKTAAIEVDRFGNLHVAWEQQTIGGGFDVYYSRLPAGSSTWNARVNLTGGTLVAEKGFQPDLEVSDNYINIAILYRNTPQQQLVYLRRCKLTSSCSSSDSWSSLREIGQFVAVSASDPFNIIPKLVYSDKVLLNYYHGITNGTNNNELLWESSDCADWGSNFLTPITARAINPSVVANNSFTIYLAYERIENDIHQIYFMSGPVGCAKGHLPMIRR